MADIWKAYQFLNESLKLNLDRKTLQAAEAGFKAQFLKDKRYPTAAAQNPSQWEFFAYLVPTKGRK